MFLRECREKMEPSPKITPGENGGVWRPPEKEQRKPVCRTSGGPGKAEKHVGGGKPKVFQLLPRTAGRKTKEKRGKITRCKKLRPMGSKRRAKKFVIAHRGKTYQRRTVPPPVWVPKLDSKKKKGKRVGVKGGRVQSP